MIWLGAFDPRPDALVAGALWSSTAAPGRSTGRVEPAPGSGFRPGRVAPSRRSPVQVPRNRVARPVSDDQPCVPDAAGERRGDQFVPRDPNPVPVSRPAACDPHLRLLADPERHQMATPSAARPEVEQARRSVVDLEFEEHAPSLHCCQRPPPVGRRDSSAAVASLRGAGSDRSSPCRRRGQALRASAPPWL